MHPAKMIISAPGPRRKGAEDKLSCRACGGGHEQFTGTQTHMEGERDEPIRRLDAQHRRYQLNSIRPLLSKPLKPIQTLHILQNIHLPLEPIPKRVSPIREGIIEQTPQREYV